MAQHLKQEWPSDRVKSFGNVDFQQEARAPAGMKKPSSGLDHPETVLDASPFYEPPLPTLIATEYYRWNTCSSWLAYELCSAGTIQDAGTGSRHARGNARQASPCS
jgi:hypothetical protein